jgi:hypothetical protein
MVVLMESFGVEQVDVVEGAVGDVDEDLVVFWFGRGDILDLEVGVRLDELCDLNGFHGCALM